MRIDDLVREHTMSVLKECNGNQIKAAKELGIADRTLRYRLNKYRKENKKDTKANYEKVKSLISYKIYYEQKVSNIKEKLSCTVKRCKCNEIPRAYKDGHIYIIECIDCNIKAEGVSLNDSVSNWNSWLKLFNRL